MIVLRAPQRQPPGFLKVPDFVAVAEPQAGKMWTEASFCLLSRKQRCFVSWVKQDCHPPLPLYPTPISSIFGRNSSQIQFLGHPSGHVSLGPFLCLHKCFDGNLEIGVLLVFKAATSKNHVMIPLGTMGTIGLPPPHLQKWP